MKLRLVLFFILWIGSSLTLAATNTRTILVAPDTEVPITEYRASTRNLVLWLPSEYGVVRAEHDIAAKLARRGYTVWVADLFVARFLPAVPSSVDAIPADDVANLIQAAAKKYPHIILLSSGRGAALTLSGAQQWQAQHKTRAIAGAVLLFPNLLAGSPEAGEEANYLPVTQHTRLPITILQGDKSPWHWQLDALKQQLTLGGSCVHIKNLLGMRDRFYFREDASPKERELADRLDGLIDDAIKNLATAKRKAS